MLNLLDVYGPPAGPEMDRELLARLDVSENSEAERAQILQNLRDLYGPMATCYWHDCGHDEGAPCTSAPAV